MTDEQKPDADAELAAMKTAFEALATLPDPRAWGRALTWIANRLMEQHRTEYLQFDALNWPKPTQYCVNGQIAEAVEDADDLVQEWDREPMTPIEVNGVAIVSQRYAVVVPIYNGEDHDGDEIMWFSTRAEAEAYCAEGRTDG